MEVRSELGILSGGDSFSVSIQQPSPSPVAQSMRMAFSGEGTAAYRPASGGSAPASYQGVGGEGTAAYRPVSGVSAPASYQGVGREGTAAYRPVSGGSAPASYQGVGGEGTAAYRPVPGGSAPASYQGVGSELPTAQGLTINSGQPLKRRRGRPKKYAPDGTVAIGLSSAPASSPTAAGAVAGSSTGVVAGSSTGFSLSYTSLAAATLPPESSSLQVEQMKKVRGRPPGSSKKHQMNDLGSGGIGFTPHVITVKAGEDVSAKIMSFSHHGPRAVCILSANGAISNVTLRQASTSGGTVTYEGRFEILSLTGSFLLSESAGQRSRTGGLSVSLAGPDGRVLGGGVAGLLTAASPVQVVVGSFIADGGKKEQQQISPLDVSSPPGKLAPGGMPGPSSPPSRGYLSESSGGGPGSAFNQSTNGNNNQQSLPNKSWK